MNKSFFSVPLILIFFMLSATSVIEKTTGDFRQKNATYPLPYHPEWEIHREPPIGKAELQAILSQPFHWLDHGHQVYAFLSEDKKYVLKIFKFKRLKETPRLEKLSFLPLVSTFYKNNEKLRIKRFNKLFEGYRVAYQYDRQHTGLIYLHLNINTSLNKTIALTDHLGFRHHLNVDDLAFAVQKPARKTKDLMMEFLDRGEIEKVKLYISYLFDMYRDEYRNGIFDGDHNLMHNTGFVGDQPIRLDVGQLKVDETIKDPKIAHADLQNIGYKRILPWFEKYYPVYQSEMKTFIDEKLEKAY